MIYKRQEYLDKLISLKDTDFIKVISGVRRGGKSVLLQQYREYLQESGIDDNHIIYINLESYEYMSINTGDALSDLIVSLLPKDDKKVYILIDEIQFVLGWEKVVNAMRVSFNVDITITGSNAKLLSGELATLIAGRYVEIIVYPFSFKEFFQAQEYNMRDVDIAYKEYVKFGGFPGVALRGENNTKKLILDGLFNSIVLKDVAARGTQDMGIISKIALYMCDNIGKLVNPTKISNILKADHISVSNHTVNKYLRLFEDAYLFSGVKQYNIKGKSFLKSNAKYFIVDHGLSNQALGYRNFNFGSRLENIVYIELMRRGYRVAVARIDNKEIDFIAKKDGKIEYYQVCHQIPENSSRESDNLLMIKDNHTKKIITGRYEGIDNINGVNVEYIVDWLLSLRVM